MLDPFAGSGTVGQVAEELGRDAVLIELIPVYVQMQQSREGVRRIVAPTAAPPQKEKEGGSGWLF